MKIQFDANQDFQLAAIAAVTDLFDGQPVGSPEYAVIDTGPSEGLLATQDRTELGIGNRLWLTDDRLRDNLRLIQNENDIEVVDAAAAPEAWDLFDSARNERRDCPHFSVEMETGTGKTYVYLRTIFELSRRYGFQKFIIVVPSVAIREGVLKNTLQRQNRRLGEEPHQLLWRLRFIPVRIPVLRHEGEVVQRSQQAAIVRSPERDFRHH